MVAQLEGTQSGSIGVRHASRRTAGGVQQGLAAKNGPRKKKSRRLPESHATFGFGVKVGSLETPYVSFNQRNIYEMYDARR